MQSGLVQGGAAMAPRMTVRRGVGALLVAEALPVVAWVLLWAGFLGAVALEVRPARLAEAARPAAAPVEARGPGAAPGRRG